MTIRGACALCVLLGACDHVLGLGTIVPTDSRRIDSAPDSVTGDASPTCPALGTAPRFGTTLHQIAPTCSAYVPSMTTGTASADCNGTPAFGAIDADPLPLTLTPHAFGSAMFQAPRLTPEGDELWVREVDLTTGNTVLEVYARSGATFVWNHDVTLPSALQSEATSGLYYLGNPTRGTTRDVVYVEYSTYILHELVVDAAGQSTEPNTTTLAAFNGLVIDAPVMLTEDGLRVTVEASLTPGGQAMIYYSDRHAVDQAFAPRTTLAGPVPDGDSAVTLREDCAELYVDAGGTLTFATPL